MKLRCTVGWICVYLSSVWEVQMQGFVPTWVSPNQQWFEATLECLLNTSGLKPHGSVCLPPMVWTLMGVSANHQSNNWSSSSFACKISVWPFAVKLFELHWPWTTIHSCVLHLYLAFPQNVLWVESYHVAFRVWLLSLRKMHLKFTRSSHDSTSCSSFSLNPVLIMDLVLVAYSSLMKIIQLIVFSDCE